MVVTYELAHHCCRLIVNACANVSVYFSPYCSTAYLSNGVNPVNADIVQEKHCYSSYIIIDRCPWSIILIVYLVNYCKITL